MVVYGDWLVPWYFGNGWNACWWSGLLVHYNIIYCWTDLVMSLCPASCLSRGFSTGGFTGTSSPASRTAACSTYRTERDTGMWFFICCWNKWVRPWRTYLLLFVLHVRVSPQRNVSGHGQHSAHNLINCGLKHTHRHHWCSFVWFEVQVFSMGNTGTLQRWVALWSTWMSSRLGLRTMLGMESWMEALKRGRGTDSLLLENEVEEEDWYLTTCSLLLRASREDLVAGKKMESGLLFVN